MFGKKFKKSEIFLLSCLSFIFGIFCASILPFNIIKQDIFLFFSAIIIFVVIVLIKIFKNKKQYIFLLFLLFFILGIWRYSISIPENLSDKIWYYNEENIVFIGTVILEPDTREGNTKLTVRTEEIKKRDFSIKVGGRVLVTTNIFPEYIYGDRLQIKCDLRAPEKFENFSYDKYLARYDIYSVCYFPKISLLNRGGGNDIYHLIFKFKNKARAIIDYSMPADESALARAIILGDKRGLSDDLKEVFSRAGISHIVAISGMHISILSAIIMSAFLFFGFKRRNAFYLASLFLVFYIALIGLPASAMRAGLMGFLVLLALNLGRLNKMTNSLVLAAFVLLWINPRLLRDDIGFQLSFLAVLGIFLFNSFFKKILKYEKIKSSFLRGAAEVLIVTMSAQVLTLPIMALNFSQISIIAPLANLLVLWTLPFLMILIIGALFFSFIFSFFSFYFFLPSFFILRYIIITSSVLTKIPGAYLELDNKYFYLVILYYIIVAGVVLRIRKNNHAK